MSQVTRSEPQRGRSIARWLGLFGVIAIIATAAVAMSGAATPRTDTQRLLHTIKHDTLRVTVTEQGTLESSSNTEIKCRVRGGSTVLWVIEAGTEVEPGDVLVRLDKSAIEDNINQQRITFEQARATLAQSESDVAVAKIGITEYLEGTFRSELKTLQKDLAIAESNLRSAQNMLEHSRRMFQRGYIGQLEVEQNEFTVQQAELELDLKKTEIDVLERFTKAKTLEELRSTLKAASARLSSDQAALDLEKARLEREEKQLENCVITADNAGMVIHPSAAQWKEAPDIEEGASVREDQVLLIIPDLTKMQVKVGIHESKVDRLSEGMKTLVTLQDRVVEGTVASIASVTRPAGWWTGNVVKYDTVVELPAQSGLKPGMSAGVEVVLADYENVLTVPVAAILANEEGYSCWVQTGNAVQRRSLDLGDTNEQFVIVNSGLKAGDNVILNPLAFVEDAQADALRPIGSPTQQDTGAPDQSAASGDAADREPAPKTEKETSGKQKLTGAAIIKLADKNGDGVLTIEEYAEKDRIHFPKTDANRDGEVDAAELDAMLKTLTP